MIKIESMFSNLFTDKVTSGHQNDDDTGNEPPIIDVEIV